MEISGCEHQNCVCHKILDNSQNSLQLAMQKIKFVMRFGNDEEKKTQHSIMKIKSNWTNQLMSFNPKPNGLWMILCRLSFKCTIIKIQLQNPSCASINLHKLAKYQPTQKKNPHSVDSHWFDDAATYRRCTSNHAVYTLQGDNIPRRRDFD